MTAWRTELPQGVIAVIQAFHFWWNNGKQDDPPRISATSLDFMKAEKNWPKFMGDRWREQAWVYFVGDGFMKKHWHQLLALHNQVAQQKGTTEASRQSVQPSQPAPARPTNTGARSNTKKCEKNAFVRNLGHGELPPEVRACLVAYHTWIAGGQKGERPIATPYSLYYMRAKESWSKFVGDDWREIAWANLVGDEWYDDNSDKIFDYLVSKINEEDMKSPSRRAQADARNKNKSSHTSFNEQTAQSKNKNTNTRRNATNTKNNDVPLTDPLPPPSGYGSPPKQVPGTRFFASGLKDIEYIKQAQIAKGVWPGHFTPGGNFPKKTSTTAPPQAAQHKEKATSERQARPGLVPTKSFSKRAFEAPTKQSQPVMKPNNKGKRKAEVVLDETEIVEETASKVRTENSEGDIDMDDVAAEATNNRKLRQTKKPRLSNQSLSNDTRDTDLTTTRKAVPMGQVQKARMRRPSKIVKLKVGSKNLQDLLNFENAKARTSVPTQSGSTKAVSNEAAAADIAMEENAPAPMKRKTRKNQTSIQIREDTPEERESSKTAAPIDQADGNADEDGLEVSEDNDGKKTVKIQGPLANNKRALKTTVQQNVSSDPNHKIWICTQYPKPLTRGAAAKKGLDVDKASDQEKMLTMVLTHKQDVNTTKTYTYAAPDWDSKKEVQALVKEITQDRRRLAGRAQEPRTAYSAAEKAWIVKYFELHPEHHGETLPKKTWEKITNSLNIKFITERSWHGVHSLSGRVSEIRVARGLSAKEPKSEN